MHLTDGATSPLIAKGNDLTLAGSANGGNLIFTTDAEGNEKVADLRIGSTGYTQDELDKGANTTVTLGLVDANYQGTLGNITMNAGDGKTTTLNVVGHGEALFTAGDILTNNSTNNIVIDGAKFATGNISEGNYKDLDNLTVRNQGVLSAKGVAELNTVTLGGGTVQVEADPADAENTGNVTIATLHGQGNVIAANKLTLSNETEGKLATSKGDELTLYSDKDVVFEQNFDSTKGQINVTAIDTLTTQAVTLQGDFINAKKWDLKGALTAGKDSIKQVEQFGTANDGSSTLSQAVTLQENALLVHGSTDALANAQAAVSATGHDGATYYTSKTLNLAAASTPNPAGTLAVGTVDLNTNAVAFGADSLLIVDSTALNGESAFIYDQPEGTGGQASVTEGAKIHAVNVKHDQNVIIFGEGFETVTGEWEDVTTDTPMLGATYNNTDKTLSVEAKNAKDIYPDLSDEMADLVTQYYIKGLNLDGKGAGSEFLRRATNSDRYLGGDRKAAASTIESAARMAFAGAVPQMTKMASDSATNSVVNRMGFANPENGAKAMNLDGKLVDDKALGLALWIAPLWSNQTGFGMEAGNLDYGYNANIGGISLGADYTWANNFRAGLMFNIGGGYAESAGGDLSETTNSMTFWGVGAYGGWKYENFAVMADVSYTSTWNSVDQDLDHRMGMGDLEADIQASAISAGLRFEYKLETQYLDLIPHVGARYMSINTWGYDVDNNEGTVLEGDGFQQNIWTFPVGITFSKELEMNNDWYFKPSVDFTVIPAAGDIKAKEDVRFTGPWAYSSELETQMMDYFTWQGGVGLEFGNDNMSVGVNYTLQAGQNSTGHGVFGMFRYEF